MKHVVIVMDEASALALHRWTAQLERAFRHLEPLHRACRAVDQGLVEAGVRSEPFTDWGTVAWYEKPAKSPGTGTREASFRGDSQEGS